MAKAQSTENAALPWGQHISRGLREAALLLLLAVAGFLLLSLVTYDPRDPGWSYTTLVADVHNAGGRVGAFFADLSLFLLGYLAYLIPAMIAFGAALVWQWQRLHGAMHWGVFGLRLAGFVVTLVAGTAVATLHVAPVPGTVPLSSGGILGVVTARALEQAFSFTGATLLAMAAFAAGFTVCTGVSWIRLAERIGRFVFALTRAVRQAINRGAESARQRRAERARRPKVVESPAPPPAEKARPKSRGRDKPKKVAKEPQVEPAPASSQRPASTRDQLRLLEDVGPGELPGTDLLDPPPAEQAGYGEEALRTMSELVETKLADFGVKVEVVAVHPGPVITRFELQPAAGVKVSQISNLSKDLARALSVTSVRVVEVIPGKSVVGLEIPNEHRQVIAFSEIIQSDTFSRAHAPLTLAIGKDIGGAPVTVDLGKMPHLLVAGTTGSGKSVGVNAMILSLVYRNTPEAVRLIMIDPKMLELSVYDDIPHLLSPVVTDMKEAANALRWCVGEMERRYRLMAALGVRNISGCNRKIGEAADRGEPLADPLWTPPEMPASDAGDPDAVPEAPRLEPMPYVVVVVDEFADMMMMVGKKVEELIARLAQKARAAGIHLILATQRPSVDVITGLIKANIPTRMAFQVSSRVDSRTILDQMGAESLLGQGDMLYLGPSSRGMPERVHGAFVSDAEVHRVAEHLKRSGSPDYVEEILEEPGSDSASIPGLSSDGGGEDSDPLYDEAVRVVTETRKASISGVQRRLKIGYNRAARLVEEMESAGIVGPLQSNGGREVLASPPPPAD
ncbi:DNA translocase FtsK 4TM domain-containing protein [Arhodomonas aquaeolei]|uniref:DNA translocase FtsK n=1 Tax=Arhodomonas aquaeolei TaxID=2369 RepID=UPI00216A0066|nr:DNA translocase FtsK [Arhodomonas aquaeolei]MCS4503217.1 DNA translocase FtsK 4TM domain-containing protein [Arhodomonas aquaeolei]